MKAERMPSKSQLTESLKVEHFRQISRTFRKYFGLGLETVDERGREVSSLCTNDCTPQFCKTIKTSNALSKRCRQERLRSLSMAFETGQPYISLCHAGIVLVCVPVMDKEAPLGGLFFGKCLWEPINKVIEADLLKRLISSRLNPKKVINDACSLPVITARTIHSASEFLYIMLYETTNLDPRIIQWRRRKSEQQAQISDFIQQQKKLGAGDKYPYQNERELINKVKIGDKIGAKKILNTILATIMFRNPGQLDVLKTRLIELLSVLSRSAAEGGVDIDLMLKRNAGYINKVIMLDTQEDVCVWISHALNEFVDSVYGVLHSNKIKRVNSAVDYIDANYNRRLKLSDVAEAAHLSVSRLAHLFKEQMGTTVIDYMISVRIDQARKLLLATDESCTRISFELGYNNQSYFCHSFKKIVGMTPRQFRKSNRR